MKTAVVVLGAKGLLGRVVFRWLKQKRQLTVWGTHHTTGNGLLLFRAENKSSDWAKIKRIVSPDMVINCVGKVRSVGTNINYSEVNADLPKWMEKHLPDIRLIHFSTDAVFPLLAGKATETSPCHPEDLYGKSKLIGETHTPQALTIRTSIIGFDPDHGRGLIEWVKQTPGTTLPGFTNVCWSGATVLQIAQLVEWLSHSNHFTQVRSRTPLLHFAPLGPVTKYSLVRSIARLVRPQITIQAAMSPQTTTRFLASNLEQLLPANLFRGTIDTALKRLYQLEIEGKL